MGFFDFFGDFFRSIGDLFRKDKKKKKKEPEPVEEPEEEPSDWYWENDEDVNKPTNY